MRWLTIILIVASIAGHARASPQAATAAAPPDQVDEVWQIVNDNFYDPKLNGVDWPAARERCKSRLKGVIAKPDIAREINVMLDELKTSHTHLYRAPEIEYYELLDIYREALGDNLKRVFPDGIVEYEGIGVRGRWNDGFIITDIYEGAPADGVGMCVGDEIASVIHPGRDLPGETPFESLHDLCWNKAGERVFVRLEHSIDDRQRRRSIVPTWIIPREILLESMRQSARVIERDGKRLAYVCIRSYASEEYQQLLIDVLNAEPLRSCDGLILDIRDGWGGANPEYVTIFGCPPPVLEMINREGKNNRIEPQAEHFVPPQKQWRKPVVLLVDGGTRSGKEVFAYAFKKTGRGKIVGTHTAGAVVGGRPFLLSDGSLLTVAVSDVRVDGVKLEGAGVEPDVVVERGEIRYSAGKDPQLDRAVEVLSDEVKKR